MTSTPYSPKTPMRIEEYPEFDLDTIQLPVRIVILSAINTGKSTLLRTLRDHLRPQADAGVVEFIESEPKDVHMPITYNAVTTAVHVARLNCSSEQQTLLLLDYEKHREDDYNLQRELVRMRPLSVIASSNNIYGLHLIDYADYIFIMHQFNGERSRRLHEMTNLAASGMSLSMFEALLGYFTEEYGCLVIDRTPKTPLIYHFSNLLIPPK